jgi:hypothetical protein
MRGRLDQSLVRLELEMIPALALQDGEDRPFGRAAERFGARERAEERAGRAFDGRGEERGELREDDLERGAEARDDPTAERREPLAGAQEVAELGVGGGEERKGDEVPLGGEVRDPERVLRIGLLGLAVRDLLPALGVGGEDGDDVEAGVGRAEEVGEGEAVAAGELDPDEHGAMGRGALLADEGERLLEPGPRRRDRERLRVGAAAGADDEGVVELAGIHADDGCGGLGELPFLVRVHRTLLGKGCR